MKKLSDGKPQAGRQAGAQSKTPAGAFGDKDKIVQQYKKEINKELKKARDDSSVTVTRFIDTELEQYASLTNVEATKDEGIAGSEYSNLQDYLIHPNDPGYLPGPNLKINWGSVFHVANFLHSFSGLLGLDRVFLDTFVRDVDFVSSDRAPHGAFTGSRADTTELPTQQSSTLAKDENIFKSFANTENEEETTMVFDLSREFGVDEHAEIRSDRLQLAMTRVCALELAALLEGGEITSESGKKDKEKSPPSFSFPVNQLTWQEITRMALVAHVMKSMDKTVITFSMRTSTMKTGICKLNYFMNRKKISCVPLREAKHPCFLSRRMSLAPSDIVWPTQLSK